MFAKSLCFKLTLRTFITHISSKIQSFSNCTYSIVWSFMGWELDIMVFLTQPWSHLLGDDNMIIHCYYLKYHVNAMITIFIYQSTIKTNTTAVLWCHHNSLLYGVGWSKLTWFIIVIDFHWHWSCFAHNIFPHGIEGHTCHTLTWDLWKRQDPSGLYNDKSLIHSPDRTPGVIWDFNLKYFKLQLSCYVKVLLELHKTVVVWH